MGVLDKFLDIMKLSDDDEYDEDDFFDDDEYDDEYEEKPKKSIFRREKTHDESDEDDYELPAKSQQRPARSNNKVTPMRQPARRTGVSMEVCVIKPTSVEDAREITETLLSGRTVILNLEGLDLEVAQRMILHLVLHMQSVEIFRRYPITSSLSHLLMLTFPEIYRIY